MKGKSYAHLLTFNYKYIRNNARLNSNEKNCLFVFRPNDLPWLYYEANADAVLTDESLNTGYKFPNSTLDLFAAVFYPNGSFVSYRPVTGGLLQLCKNSDTFLDAAYVFGTTYEQSVSSVSATQS